MSDSVLRKGQLLVVKVPPYYDKSYFYEVVSAGNKLVRAHLYHSEKVKRSWSMEEFNLLKEMGIVRLAEDDEKPSSPAQAKSQ